MKRGMLPSAFKPGSAAEIQQVSLRRRATFDIFKSCSLGPPPRVLFAYTDSTDNVDVGIERFLGGLGCSDIGEISDAQEALIRLNRLDHAYERLDESAKVDWLERLLAGDAAQSDEVLRELEASRTSTEVTDDWPDGACPPSLLNIATLCQSSSDEDGSVSLLLRRLNSALSSHYRLQESLALSWPERWYSSPEELHLAELLNRFQLHDLKLMTMGGVDQAALETSISDMEEANLQLSSLVVRANNFRGRPTAALPVSISVTASKADALEFFGFPSGARPAKEEMLARWKKIRLEHHPDWPGLSPEETASRADTSETADILLAIMEKQTAS